MYYAELYIFFSEGEKKEKDRVYCVDQISNTYKHKKI